MCYKRHKLLKSFKLWSLTLKWIALNAFGRFIFFVALHFSENCHIRSYFSAISKLCRLSKTHILYYKSSLGFVFQLSYILWRLPKYSLNEKYVIWYVNLSEFGQLLFIFFSIAFQGFSLRKAKSSHLKFHWNPFIALQTEITLWASNLEINQIISAGEVSEISEWRSHFIY